MTSPFCYFYIGNPNYIEEFRKACISNEQVSCNWSRLESWLNAKAVSKIWWDLTETERRSVAEMTIRNTLFYKLRYGRSGSPDCEGGEGDLKNIVCVQNGLIRTLKFGSYSGGGHSCYYRQYIDSEEYCYVPEVQYGLPCHIVTCVTYGSGFGHTMCSIQVVDEIDSMDNWIIFQYSDFDIKRGSSQIPSHRYDLYIRFGKLTGLSCGGYSDTTVVRFEHI